MTERDLTHRSASVDTVALNKLIRSAKQGDIGSFQKIYDIFAKKILNYIYRMVNSIEEAEDLTQETFASVYQNLGSLRDDRKFQAWLFRIARNHAYMCYRTRPSGTVSLDTVDEEGDLITELADKRKTPDEAFQASELEDVVAEVISSLPEKYREVFVLSAIQHLSYQEIADVVGRSLPSVKTDIHRARLEVRQKVKDYLKV